MKTSEFIKLLTDSLGLNGDLPVYHKDYTFTVSDVELNCLEVYEKEDVSQKGTSIKVLPERIVIF